jgi:hypothetical protein
MLDPGSVETPLAVGPGSVDASLVVGPGSVVARTFMIRCVLCLVVAGFLVVRVQAITKEDVYLHGAGRRCKVTIIGDHYPLVF